MHSYVFPGIQGKSLTSSKEVLKKHLTFADFTGQNIDEAIPFSKLTYVRKDFEKLQHKTVDSFVQVFEPLYLNARTQVVLNEIEKKQADLDFLRSSPHASPEELKVFENMLNSLKAEKANLDAGIYEQSAYNEFMKTVLIFGEIESHQLNSPVRKVLATIKDFVPIVPIIEANLKYDFIRKEYLTDEQAANHMLGGLLSTILLPLGAGAGLGWRARVDTGGWRPCGGWRSAQGDRVLEKSYGWGEKCR